MVNKPKNIAASVKSRLLTMSRERGKGFEILLVRFALERLLFRLSISEHRNNYILKGGMLITQWIDNDDRETRDMDFLGFGTDDQEGIRAIFTEIMTLDVNDGLIFDTKALTTTRIRESMEYGGIRLKTVAYLESTRIPVTLDIGFGDALVNACHSIKYASLLGMESQDIRCYPPEAVIAEKFQAVVALGLANGRMKDFYDLWVVPQSLPINPEALDAAILATFTRRATPIPLERPIGLSNAMAEDTKTTQRWKAYIKSLELSPIEFKDVLDDIWKTLAPSCTKLATSCQRVIT